MLVRVVFGVLALASVSCAVDYTIKFYLASGRPCPDGETCCEDKMGTVKFPGDECYMSTALSGTSGTERYFSYDSNTSTLVFGDLDSNCEDPISMISAEADGECFKCSTGYCELTAKSSASMAGAAATVVVAVMAALAL